MSLFVHISADIEEGGGGSVAVFSLVIHASSSYSISQGSDFQLLFPQISGTMKIFCEIHLGLLCHMNLFLALRPYLGYYLTSEFSELYDFELPSRSGH